MTFKFLVVFRLLILTFFHSFFISTLQARKISNAPLNSLMDSNVSPKGENIGRIINWGMFPGS